MSPRTPEDPIPPGLIAARVAMPRSDREFVLGMVEDAERNSRRSERSTRRGLADEFGVARFPGQLGELAEQLRAEGLLFYVPEVRAWHSRAWYRDWTMAIQDLSTGTAGEE